MATVTYDQLARTFTVACPIYASPNMVDADGASTNPESKHSKQCLCHGKGKLWPLLEACDCPWDGTKPNPTGHARCSGTGLIPLDPDRGAWVLMEALRKRGYKYFEAYEQGHNRRIIFIISEGIGGLGRRYRGEGDTWQLAFFAAVGEMQKQEAKG